MNEIDKYCKKHKCKWIGDITSCPICQDNMIDCPCCNGIGKIPLIKKQNPKTIAVKRLRKKGLTFQQIKNQLCLSSTSVAYYHYKK